MLGKDSIRKAGAAVFAGCFIYNWIVHILYNPSSVLVHPLAEFMWQSIIGWTVLMLLPFAGAFLMYQNKRSGLFIVGIYAVLILLISAHSIYDPNFDASDPITDQEKTGIIIRSAIKFALMSFILFCIFTGFKNHESKPL